MATKKKKKKNKDQERSKLVEQSEQTEIQRESWKYSRVRLCVTL